MSRLPVSTPGAVVIGARVVEGAALVVVAAVVAAHVQRQKVSIGAHHSCLLASHGLH